MAVAGGGGGGGGGRGSPPPSTVGGSDSDSDGQGAAELYGEDEGSEKCQGSQEDFGAGRSGGGGDAKEVADEGKYDDEEEEEEAQAKGGAAADGEDKAKKEPYAEPRIGAFFMHDDRFHDKENHSRPRHREFFGGQKLRHPKDDSVWVHDLFDEINIHDVQHDNIRRPTIPFGPWAGDRTHGVNHGYLEGTKSPSYYHGNRADYKYIPKSSLTRYESSNNYNRFPNEAHTSYDNSKNYRSIPRKLHSYYDDNNFDNARREPPTYHLKGIGYAPNVYRGKPSRPYQPHWKSTFGISSVQRNRTYSRSQNEEACSSAGEGKCYYRTSDLQNEQDIPLKEKLPLIQRRKAPPAIFSKLFTTSVHMAHSSLKTQYRPVLGVKPFVPSGGHENAVDSGSTVSIKAMPSLGSHSSVSTSNNYSQYSKSRDQGGGLNNGESAKNRFSSTSQATGYDTEFSDAVYQQRSVQQLQPRQRASTQIFHQNIVNKNNIQSHPQATSTSSTEDAETSPPPGSKNSEAPAVVIGQTDKEEPVSASFSHDGGQALRDQGFPGTPASLPAMQFSGQHPNRPDIPSIGMALPGVLSHQLGGNSEMNHLTWLPTLSGAAGSFGETYHPCYLGSYYPQPSQLSSSSVSSRNHSVTGVPVSLNSHEISEVVDQELQQRKNKPRRYSEMSFAS